MYLTGLEAEHFRNLAHIRLEPDPRYNLIVGQNAQGKTNLLEAIWLLTGCRSFRGARERDLIGFDQEVMRMQAAFRDSRRDQQITYALQRSSREKKITLNGVPLRGGSRLFQQFQDGRFGLRRDFLIHNMRLLFPIIPFFSQPVQGQTAVDSYGQGW